MSVLAVNDVSIRYMTGDFKDIGLKEYILRKVRGDYHIHEFWADKDISFSLEQGDMLGIIGTNGAGKSTLLKAISGIMEPTRGCVKRNGTVAALLELASGFDGDLTVRENTYLRGAMLGYTRKFMDETYEQIIAFAELEDFQDRPFKQLSSGMKSRLAFSIASLVKPDILILDEVLSVGDGAFRKKSEKKMREIIEGGATTILVSHSLEQVRQMCTKVLWLDKGRQVAFGSNVQEICDQYQMFLEGKNGPILKEGCSEKREGDVMEVPGSSVLSSMKKNQYIRFFGALLFAVLTTAALGVNYSIASWDIAAQAIGSQNSILVSLVKLRQNFNLYTLPWQICALLLWGIYYKLGKSWRFSAVEVVISLLFGTINVISNSLVVNGNWGFAFANTYQAVVASACVIGQAALFLSIIRLSFWLLDGLRNWKRKPVEPKGLARLFEKYPWRFSFCVLLLCWLPDLLIAYPAQLTFDGANQLQQWMKIIPQTNAHPFLTTVIYGALFEIGQLFGNDNFTVFFIALAQSCIMAASFAVVVKKIKGMNIPKSIPVAILVFYGLHPMWGEYAHTIIKDSISVPVFTLFMLEIASFALDSVNYVSKKTNCCKIVSTGVLACMLRHNYKYAVIPAVLLAFGVVIWKNRQYWKRAIICVVILGGCLQTGGWIAESILKYSAGSVREALSIPFQQTARYVRDFPEEVTQEEKEAIAAVLDYEALANAYNPNSSDPVKNTYHGDQNSLKNYVSVWTSMFIKHPETYFEATVHGSHAYYAYTPYLGVRTMADILRRDSVYRTYAERLGMDISHPEQMEPALIAWENTKELFIRAPISGLFCNCATYTWILLLLGIYFLKKKDWTIYYILVPLFLVVFTCIASPVNGNWRYFAPVVASVPIAIAASSMMIVNEQTSDKAAMLCGNKDRAPKLHKKELSDANPLKQHRNIIGFDLFRIVLAFFVFLFHIQINLGFTTSIEAIDKIISVGAICMVGFFMLSGYTLTLKYEKISFQSGDDLKQFYKKRFIRIYPSYFIFLLIILLFHCSFPDSVNLLLLLIPIDILGLQAHFPKAFPYLGNGGTWFISVLLFLYLVFPFLLHYINSIRWNKYWLIGGCYLVAVYIGLLRVFMGGDFAQYYANPLFRVPEFLIGIGLANMRKSDAISLRKSIQICMVCLIFYCAGILIFYDIVVGGVALFKQNYLSYDILAIPVFGTAIVALSKGTITSLPDKLCAMIRFIGKMTFHFYLTQTFANRLVRKWVSSSYLGISVDGNAQILCMSLTLNIIFALLLLCAERIVVRKVCAGGGAFGFIRRTTWPELHCTILNVYRGNRLHAV